MFLSLIIMMVLLLAIYQAYKTFSGVDPLKVSPGTLINSFLNSDSAVSLIKKILTVDPTGKAKSVLENKPAPVESQAPRSPLLYKFAIVTDSHNDNASLRKALMQAKNEGVKFVIALGDYTDVGTVDDLSKSKQQFDEVGLPYYTTVGDHDLWESREKGNPALTNFNQVYGPSYQAFTYLNTRFIIFYDADNYLGIDEAQKNWLNDQLDSIKQNPPKLAFALTSTPLYHPSSDHVLGKTDPKLKPEAQDLAKKFKEAGINEVIAGDTHYYSRYIDPSNDLKMTSIGAVTSLRNPQSPRFAIVDVFEDGSYNIQDTEIK